MTRKDYIRLAEALKVTLSLTENDSERTGVNKAVGAIAHTLGQDNPRFDTQRFYNWIDGVKK